MVNQFNCFKKRYWTLLSPYKLTAGQPKVLDFLGKHNGCIQNQSPQGVKSSRQRLPVYCHAWKKKSLLYVKQKDGNKRSLYVYLTDEANGFKK